MKQTESPLFSEPTIETEIDIDKLELKKSINVNTTVEKRQIEIGSDRRGKIADISLIAGKEFRNWVVKDLDPPSQAVLTVKNRRRNIVLSFSHDSVMKTYNVHRAIGAQRARDQMGRDRQGRPKNKRSKRN
ncbi:hypothetical protein TNCV_174361 [Trichonephila clavipes]|nr:hypothetical protein TNCV_174361 [Trichonephila clavipes]